MKTGLHSQSRSLPSNSKLHELLGPAKFLIHPILSVVALLLVTLLLAPFARQPISLPLAALSTYLLLMAVKLEQPWLSVTPLPPLTILTLGAWIRCGLGGLLLSLGRPMAATDANSAYWRHLPQAQLLWLAVSGAAVLVFALKPAQMAIPAVTAKDAPRQPLVGLTIALGIFAVTSITIGIVTGTLDRNPQSYLYWVSQRWRPDAIFTMLGRFRDVFFFLAPLAFTRAKHGWQRRVILVMAAMYPAIAIPLGGRGLVVYPFAYAIAGLWLTSLSVKILRSIAALALIGCLIAVPSIELYRTSENFSSLRRADTIKRLDLLANTIGISATQLTQPELLNRAGQSLYACSDSFLFQEPALSRPRAGLIRAQTILTAFLPELLFPKKVPVRDAHIIAEEVRGSSRIEAETKQYNGFQCVSYGGDLYWRGGWIAVVAGAIVFSLFYRMMSQFWYNYAQWNSTWQIMLLAYPVTFLTLYPVGSIGETAWLWMWDLPKYAITIAMIFLLTRWLNRSQTPTL